MDLLATILQLVCQVDDTAVDFTPSASMTDFRVHVVSKVERRCTVNQINHLAFWREHIDPFGVELLRKAFQ